jgi:hypothetical protein
MKQKRFRLDPNETALENLWRAAKVATVTLLRKYHIRSFIDDKYIDLFDELTMQTVVSFMYLKIRNKGYDRRFSFYENVYSCCWGCSVVKKYIKSEEERKTMISLSHESDDGGALEATLECTERHSLDIDNTSTPVKQPKPMKNNAVLYHAEEDLKRLWEMDDLEAESDLDAVEIGEHRDAIMRRVHEITSTKEFQRKLRTQQYNTTWCKLNRRRK